MADTKISALTSTAILDDADEFAINAAGVSKKITAADVRAALGGVSLPEIKHTEFVGPVSSGITITGYTPVAGDRIILVLDGFNSGQATVVSSTNTTWTQLATFDNAGGQFAAIWVGECASSPGTAITVTHPNTYMSIRAVIVPDVLTPTLVQVDNFEANELGVLTGVTPGNLIVMSAGTDNTGLRNALWIGGIVPAGPAHDIVPVQLGYALAERVDMSFGLVPGAGFIAEIT